MRKCFFHIGLLAMLLFGSIVPWGWADFWDNEEFNGIPGEISPDWYAWPTPGTCVYGPVSGTATFSYTGTHTVFHSRQFSVPKVNRYTNVEILANTDWTANDVKVYLNELGSSGQCYFLGNILPGQTNFLSGIWFPVQEVVGGDAEFQIQLEVSGFNPAINLDAIRVGRVGPPPPTPTFSVTPEGWSGHTHWGDHLYGPQNLPVMFWTNIYDQDTFRNGGLASSSTFTMNNPFWHIILWETKPVHMQTNGIKLEIKTTGSTANRIRVGLIEPHAWIDPAPEANYYKYFLADLNPNGITTYDIQAPTGADPVPDVTFNIQVFIEGIGDSGSTVYLDYVRIYSPDAIDGTFTPTPTATPWPTETLTATPVESPSPEETGTAIISSTYTVTPEPSATITPTLTLVMTAIGSTTPAVTVFATKTCSASSTATFEATFTPIAINTSVATPTATIIQNDNGKPTLEANNLHYEIGLANIFAHTRSRVIVSPQPARGDVKFICDYYGPGEIIVDLYSLTGELVAHIRQIKNNSGAPGSVRWLTRDTAAGIYLAVVTQKNEQGQVVYQEKKRIALVE